MLLMTTRQASRRSNHAWSAPRQSIVHVADDLHTRAAMHATRCSGANFFVT
jgi:hypothetical protein